MALKTDYKDYIASGDPKYQISANADGTSGIKDVTEYSQTGDSIGAAGLNATNKAVNALACVTVSLAAASWTGTAAPYTQTVAVSGMTADWVPGIPMLASSGVVATDLAMREALACVSLIESSAGALTFACYEDKPTADINAKVPGVI